jgi:ATP-dependent Zn protease
MCVLFGGRVAEQIIFGRISTGASDDLQKITQLAYSQIARLGMNDKLGNISYQEPKGGEVRLVNQINHTFYYLFFCFFFVLFF